jgi:hypothetical protein
MYVLVAVFMLISYGFAIFVLRRHSHKISTQRTEQAAVRSTDTRETSAAANSPDTSKLQLPVAVVSDVLMRAAEMAVQEQLRVRTPIATRKLAHIQREFLHGRSSSDYADMMIGVIEDPYETVRSHQDLFSPTRRERLRPGSKLMVKSGIADE